MKPVVSKCNQYTIRPIEPQDNPAVADITIQTLASFGFVGEGYACSDPELPYMYETYRDSDGKYFVIVDNDTQKVLGGCGFSRLKGTTIEESTCELQKLYFRPELRGKGLAPQILSLCIEQATQMGFRTMYLESTPVMTTAIDLYKKFGFEHLSQPMGNTGHNACSVFMRRALPQLCAV